MVWVPKFVSLYSTGESDLNSVGRKKSRSPMDGERVTSPELRERSSRFTKGRVSSMRSVSTSYDRTNPGILIEPHPVISGPSGSKFVGMPYSDAYSTGRVQLCGIADVALTQLNGFTVGFGGGVNVVGQDLFSKWVNQLGDQVNAKAASKGLSITNYNTTGTYNASYVTYLARIADIIRSLYTLRCISKLAGLNQACSAIAALVNQNIPRIDSQISRLKTFFVPPAYTQMVKKMSGVFMTGKSSDAPFFDFNPDVTTAQTDISVAANIVLILDGVDTLFGLINAIAAADISNVQRVNAYLYQPVDIGEGEIKVDEEWYCNMLSRLIIYNDSAATNVNTAPTITGMTSAPLIPLWVYGDPTRLDPQWLTLARPVFAANSTAIATPVVNLDSFGMFDAFQGAAGFGTSYMKYTSGPTFTNESSTDFTGAGVKTITALTGSAFDFPWAPLAMEKVTAANQLNNDTRIMSGWAMYYVSLADFSNNTIVLFHDMFSL